MIRRESFINKIRGLGYTYKTQQKRTTLWRQSGTTNFMSVPMRDWLTDEYVTSALRQAGCTKEEVEAFLASAKT